MLVKKIWPIAKKRLFVRGSNLRKAKSVSRIDQIYSDPSIVYIDESGIDGLFAKTDGWGRRSEKLVGKKSGE
ncbi:hypothetical protein [Holospora undulata]|uniref:hypothetical protein n=1 Tax=Holospora undulata TaxID=1169117 RepID=UPI0003C4F35B|nr:hypothetical protein [Holospora undulata]